MQVPGCVYCRIEIMRWPDHLPKNCPSCREPFAMINTSTGSPSGFGSTVHRPEEADAPVEGQRGAQRQAGVKVTEALPPVTFTPPADALSMFKGGASTMGLSWTSTYLSCPEQARLKALGVKPKKRETVEDGPVVLDEPTDFGQLMHTIRATRIVWGQDAALWLLNSYNIDEASRFKALSLIKLYDHLFPLPAEPFEYIGVEAEVVTDIGDGQGGSMFRSVRYDSVIRFPNGDIFSFECKTTARSGENQLSQYTAQSFTHTALWNANPNLVAQHGPMRGTIYDLMVKTETPQCDRLRPRYVSKLQQQRAIEYLRLAESIQFPRNADGSFPRMLNSCWGRYRPCVFINLCHENAHGEYEIPEAGLR